MPPPPEDSTQASAWFVYVLRCADGSLYTGVATDVERRLAEHRAGGARGAKYLRGRGPLELVLEHAAGDRASALRIEGRIKRLPRPRKEALILDPTAVAALAADS